MREASFQIALLGRERLGWFVIRHWLANNVELMHIYKRNTSMLARVQFLEDAEPPANPRV